MTMPTDRAYAAVIADWCARSLAEAKESGAFDTRCFVQNADLIIAALREYAVPGEAVFCTHGPDFVAIKRDLKSA